VEWPLSESQTEIIGEVLKGASHGLFHTRITYEAGENFGKIVITHQEQ
jgi:hypothetical protein